MSLFNLPRLCNGFLNKLDVSPDQVNCRRDVAFSAAHSSLEPERVHCATLWKANKQLEHRRQN